MGIEFEGAPPYELPVAQAAEARPTEDGLVELTFRVSLPGKLPTLAPVRIRLSHETALGLGIQTKIAAETAERWIAS
jgi:hypothetical protein